MFVFKRILFFIAPLIFISDMHWDLLKDKILTENVLNNNACLIYQPYLGVVEDMESLDIKSENFEITENQALILDGNVVIADYNTHLRSN